MVDTVYFGGGTPSLLDPAALAKFIDALRARYALRRRPKSRSKPIPKQSRRKKPPPGSPPASTASASASNRSTIANSKLPAACIAAPTSPAPREILRAAGFDNISMDLIAGLPHQTRETWDDSLAQLLHIRPEHISIYMLEIDEGSRLGKESLAGGSRYSAGAISPATTQSPNSTNRRARDSPPQATSTTKFRTGRCRATVRGTI